MSKSIVISLLALAALCFKSNEAIAGSPLIFPIPQQQKSINESFLLDENVVIALPENASTKDKELARLLVKELSDKYGIALKMHLLKSIPKDKKLILMGTSQNALVREICAKRKLVPNSQSKRTEGYYLNVTKNEIVISGWDDAGAFFGLQSLRQLIRAGNGKSVQGIEVNDWPNFPFRAIRLYVPGPDNIPYFKRFISEFMALYKYNKIVIEFNCMRLDNYPEVNTGWQEFVKYMQYSRSNSTEGIRGEEKNSSHYDAGDGFIIEKETVRDLVKFANDNFLEVIPEIPSLTHAYYLLTKHPELAEYTGDVWPDTYCPSNPKSYELMFGVYDEYMEVIKPKMVHIGHDEWWGAPTEVCPLCRGKDYSKLFAGDVQKIHGYFAKKGIKVAMWGDYLLESVREKGTQKRTSSTGVKYEIPGALPPQIVKELIPKDILIFNWFWIDQEKEKELDKMGFKQIYGNFTPNISDWKQRTKNIKLEGGAPSSWASTNEFTFGKDLMLDFLGCANLLWSSHIIEPIKFPEIVWGLIPSIRASLSGKRVPSEDDNIVETVDISSHFNLKGNTEIFNMDLSNMRSGEIKNGNMRFNIGAKKPNDPVVVAVGVQGKTSNPLSLHVKNIQINEDVSSLIFLHASALPAGNQKAYFNIPNFFDTPDLLGWYEVVYEDGFKSIIPLQYGANIMEWNPGGEKSLDTLEGETGAPQKAYCYEADPVNCASAGKAPSFFAYEWVNKRFGKTIREVNLYGSVNFQAQQQDYGTVVSAPMESNAIILAAISKVKKRERIRPKKE